MNYLKLILALWKLRRSKRITSIQADLYMFLVYHLSEQLTHPATENDWKNPFECPNRLIVTTIGISESAITDARNRLKQLGMIDFKPGKRNELAPVYQLFYPFKSAKVEGKQEGKKTGKQEGKGTNIYNKEELKETEVEGSVTNVTGDGSEKKEDPKKLQPERKKGSAQKKKDEAGDVTQHWQDVVKVWFDFNRENFNGFEPSFKGQDPKHLKAIVDNLEKRSVSKKVEWTAKTAIATLQKFLKYSMESDKWLHSNFLLSNLEKQLDKLLINATTGKAINGNGNSQKGTVASAFSKIDAMPD